MVFALVVDAFVCPLNVLTIRQKPLEVAPTIDEGLGDENVVDTKNQPQQGEHGQIDTYAVNAEVIGQGTEEKEVVKHLDDRTKHDNYDGIPFNKKLV